MLNNIDRKEIWRFCTTGGFCFLLEYALLIALVELYGWDYWWAAGTAFTFSTVVNLIMCQRYVFNTGKTNARKTSLFIGSSIAGLVLHQIFMYLFIDVCGLFYMVSKILSTGLVTIWNYITKKLILT